MAIESGNTLTDTVVNYAGELLSIGNNSTPFLQILGGMGNIRPVNSLQFAMSETWDVGTGAQPSISESESLTASPSRITRAQEYNVLELHKYDWNVSYSKLGSYNQMGGINVGLGSMIEDERSKQELGFMLKIAKDLEASLIKGVYAGVVDSDTATKTRGVSSAVSTLAVDAGGAALSLTLLKSLWKAYADQNGTFNDGLVLWVNSFQKQALNAIYGLQERSVNVGGVNLDTIVTDFGFVGVQYSPNVPTDEALLVDMNAMGVVGLNVPEKGVFFSEVKEQSGASVGGMLYGMLGCDYGAETLHAKLDGLATA